MIFRSAATFLAIMLTAAPVVAESTKPTKEAQMTVISAAILLSTGADGDAVAIRYAALGLETQRIGENTILLTGPMEKFETALATPLSMSGGGISTTDGSTQVPLSRLSDELRQGVAEIAFERPPDFGPGNF